MQEEFKQYQEILGKLDQKFLASHTLVKREILGTLEKLVNPSIKNEINLKEDSQSYLSIINPSLKSKIEYIWANPSEVKIKKVIKSSRKTYSEIANVLGLSSFNLRKILKEIIGKKPTKGYLAVKIGHWLLENGYEI